MNLTEGAGARMNHRGAIILATERALCVLLLSRTGARHRPRRVPVRIIFRESFGRVSCVPPKDIKVNHLSDAISAVGFVNIFLHSRIFSIWNSDRFDEEKKKQTVHSVSTARHFANELILILQLSASKM